MREASFEVTRAVKKYPAILSEVKKSMLAFNLITVMGVDPQAGVVILAEMLTGGE